MLARVLLVAALLSLPVITMADRLPMGKEYRLMQACLNNPRRLSIDECGCALEIAINSPLFSDYDEEDVDSPAFQRAFDEAVRDVKNQNLFMTALKKAFYESC